MAVSFVPLCLCTVCDLHLTQYNHSHTLDWDSQKPANPKDLWNFLEGVYWSQLRKVSRHLDL